MFRGNGKEVGLGSDGGGGGGEGGRQGEEEGEGDAHRCVGGWREYIKLENDFWGNEFWLKTSQIRRRKIAEVVWSDQSHYLRPQTPTNL